MKDFWNKRLGAGPGRAVRITLLCLSGLSALWFFLPLLIYGVFNIGNITGLLVSCGAYCCILFLTEIRAFLTRCAENRVFRAALVFVGAVAAAAVILCAVLTIRIFAAAIEPPQDDATVVLLGCQVNGTRPSLMLQRRIDAAADYLTAHPDAVCILSGGQGEDEEISEAACMLTALTEAGIDPARLRTEDRSTSTRENLAYSMEIIRAEGLPERLCIVTNEFHQYRARLIAETYTDDLCAVSAPSPVVLLPTYVVREWYAILAQFVFGGPASVPGLQPTDHPPGGANDS